MSLSVHKVLYLYESSDKFYIQPVEHPEETLILDRQTCDITVGEKFSPPQSVTSSLIYGIIGIKHLTNNTYLIVITHATIIGAIDNWPIYRMDRAKVIPFDQNATHHGWDEIYVSMLDTVLKTTSFYFSYTYDLTNSMQRSESICNTKASNQDDRNYPYYDKRFLWNDHLISSLDRCGDRADKYKLPFILGFIRINKIHLNYGCHFTLISRRSVYRAGTRFNSRGIDDDGNVSNFVETEQIFEEVGFRRVSFVQVRGSIPLVWKQTPGYKYKPAIEINPNYDHDTVMRKHFEDLVHYYNEISVINLIDHRGHEGNLEHEFSQRIQKLHNIAYHYFDFHKECSKMRWHRLSLLMDIIRHEIESFGYFEIQNCQVLSTQKGVFRVNCIDSLDRTNVVESMIAQRVLEIQLAKFECGPASGHLQDYPMFMSVFKDTWADNADALSIQYAGTPALKTDFTRTGKRTHSGMIKDGINSLTRYISNNYLDQYRQDAIGLFLGRYEGSPSPLYRPMNLTSYTSTVSVTMVVVTLFILFFYYRY